MKKNAFPVFLLFLILISISFSSGSMRAVSSQDNPPQDGTLILLETETLTPYFTVERYVLADGTILDMDIINGPPQPPPGFEAEREASIVVDVSRSTLATFPSYDWVFGCSAVSGTMIAGYYDRTGYPNIYTGPTNGGVMPITDTSWPFWTDTAGVTYPNNPLVASKSGVDGWVGRGSIENYWVHYNSTAPDPYITYGWPEHIWGTAVGDYMKTSQSAWPYQSRDGNTWFWNYSDQTKLTCGTMELHSVSGGAYTVAQVDGTYGRKRFYEARGYMVTDCYNQLTDTQVTGGFSLADFKAQIDAGHPVLLNLQGHTIVGFGYNGSTIYIRDTWDSNPENIYSMSWSGSYHGMVLRSVSVVRLAPPALTSAASPMGVSASDGTYYDKVRVSWDPVSDAAYYKVYRNIENKFSGAIQLTTSPAWSPFDDRWATSEVIYHYWVVACNSAGCSGPSSPSTGRRGSSIPQFLPLFTR